MPAAELSRPGARGRRLSSLSRPTSTGHSAVEPDLLGLAKEHEVLAVELHRRAVLGVVATLLERAPNHREQPAVAGFVDQRDAPVLRAVDAGLALLAAAHACDAQHAEDARVVGGIDWGILVVDQTGLGSSTSSLRS
jgi:hypothetical protein